MKAEKRARLPSRAWTLAAMLAVVAALELGGLVLGREGGLAWAWDAAALGAVAVTALVLVRGAGISARADRAASEVETEEHDALASASRVRSQRGRALANTSEQGLLLHRGGEIVDFNEGVPAMFMLSSDFAATPSPSWIRPSRMCSVPM